MRKEKMKKIEPKIVVALFLSIFLLPHIVSAAILSYDSVKNSISFGYDSLNRITNQSTISSEFVYMYDEEKNETLTNVTDGNVTISYTYDDRKRVISQIKEIDGYSFVRSTEYDSRDVVTSLDGSMGELTFNYGDNGLVEAIVGLLNLDYNPNSQILGRDFNNSLDSNYSHEGWMVVQPNTTYQVRTNIVGAGTITLNYWQETDF